MKKTTNLIIIDASGSMESKKEAVVNGLKELLAQIKIDAVKDKAKVKTSTIVIDFSGNGDVRELVNVSSSITLKDSISADYKTRGMTALYDAIGKGFNMVGKKEKNVFVSILTDGEENDSKEFKHEDVKKLIEKKRKLGWAITFREQQKSLLRVL
jgi:Mg-chelatase subunit ChlD